MEGSLHSVEDFKAMMQACDEAILSVDKAVGIIHQQLREAGDMDDVVIIISADHGENFGEWSTYAAHCTADAATANIPLIISGGGLSGNQAVDGLCQHIDLASTICEIAGVEQPSCWNAQALPQQGETTRHFVVTSQLAQCVQRSVHWLHDGNIWGYLSTAHDLNHGLPEECVYRPADKPPVPLNNTDRLHQGRKYLSDFIHNHKSEHPDPWDEICQAGQ